jgi:VanZ family protein
MSDGATGGRGRWPVVAGLAGVAAVAQLWGLYRVAGPPASPWFPHADKLEHAVGFALPVALLLVALGLRAAELGRAPGRRSFVAVVGLFAAHAVVSELVQHAFYTSRTGDPFDVLADLFGVAAGALLARAALRGRAGGRATSTAGSGRSWAVVR